MFLYTCKSFIFYKYAVNIFIYLVQFLVQFIQRTMKIVVKNRFTLSHKRTFFLLSDPPPSSMVIKHNLSELCGLQLNTSSVITGDLLRV